jgi:multicomponent Na+:H+ antiporter subunit D
MSSIIAHAPALQIIIPLFAALFSALSFNQFYSWSIASVGIAASLLLSIYFLIHINISDALTYNFGGWVAPIGIEYRIDYLNQPIIVLLNAVLFFFLIFGKELIDKTITSYIDKGKNHLFYSLLLFAHVGHLGVASTNDLFNIYVFIEISSLATYVLMSKGKDPKALIGAFDYLILGTIGATLILIAIGFLLALTGSLNITDVANILEGQYSSRIVITAIAFFLTGALLKMAFFPMHFWMVKTYSSAPPFILTYLASISSIMGVYMILRFIHFTIEEEIINEALVAVIRPISMATIIICTILALKTNTLKKIVIYSTASQIGYIILLVSIWSARDLLFQLLILDSINKISLFTIIAHIQCETDDLKFASFKYIENSSLFKLLTAASIMFSAGLPITSMFIVKLKMFDLLFSQNLYLEFLVVVIGSIFGLLYHIKFFKTIFFSPKSNGIIQIKTKISGLAMIIILQIITIIYIQDIANMTKYTKSVIAGSNKNDTIKTRI